MKETQPTAQVAHRFYLGKHGSYLGGGKVMGTPMMPGFVYACMETWSESESELCCCCCWVCVSVLGVCCLGVAVSLSVCLKTGPRTKIGA